jgi:cellulose synthase/poly-beta-1,6-N-acetylglucosamine synthase-like glycosyltransferase
MTPLLEHTAQLTAWLIALAWLWKAITAAIGMPRLPNLSLPQHNVSPHNNPSLTVIVPARDEAANIAATLQSLLNQDYPNLQILAVDDRSTDQTGAIIDTLAARHPTRLRAIHVTELPAGWLGKTHALALAARHAIALYRPDYLLFTDADVLFEDTILRRSLAQAAATRADHFVTFPTPIVKTIGEGTLLGYLGVMGLWATRPWRASNPKALRDSIGIGAFNLFRTPAYQQLGGFDALRMQILEDLTFARRVKLAGLRQQVAVAPGMVTLHWASGAIGIINVMTKNLFAVFQFRTVLALLFCLWLALFCVTPAAFLFLSATRMPAILTFLAIAILYLLSSRHSRVSPWYALLFPAGALLMLYSVLSSTWTTLTEGGVCWRGTFYPLAELRKNAVARESIFKPL